MLKLRIGMIIGAKEIFSGSFYFVNRDLNRCQKSPDYFSLIFISV